MGGGDLVRRSQGQGMGRDRDGAAWAGGRQGWDWVRLGRAAVGGGRRGGGQRGGGDLAGGWKKVGLVEKNKGIVYIIKIYLFLT